MKSFHIITFGCQMNEHDSERMAGVLATQGYGPADRPAQADLVILNTCSIREKAEQKFFSELGRLRELKAENPGMQIAVAGCIAQQKGNRILSRAPYVDMVFGTADIGRLSEIVEKRQRLPSPVVETSGDPDYHRRSIPSSRADTVKAWVSIMYGCDNFCTYCVVPYLRGRERSRSPEDIIKEVRDLAGQGFREVTLLGQNVNSYGKGLERKTAFPELLRMVNDVPGIERIRFVTSHPRDLSAGLIRAFADLPKLCEAIHLPLQSGSDRVLKAMNRKYSRRDYLDRVRRLRETVPDIAITTDIIAGFPGEGEEDFAMTMDLLEKVRYDNIFAFKYSRRPGTAALGLTGHLPEKIKEVRLTAVLALQKRITQDKNNKHVGTVEELLIEGRSKRGGTLAGRTRGNTVVNVKGPESLIGSLVRARITTAGSNSLFGELCE